MAVYDAVVIGAGHNGLVAAAYLARAGRKVLVLEKRPLVGGATVTEEIVPGYKFSRLSYVSSLFRPDILRELKLASYGFELLPRNPSSFTPFPDGRHLLLGPDSKLNQEQIGKFSQRDAEVFPRYEALLERMVTVIEPLLDRRPARLHGLDLFAWVDLIKAAWRAKRLGREFYRFLSMLTGPASNFLDEWFESEELKTTLATDAIIGAMASPSSPGTAYVLFHHVMGETNGARGVWAYVRGGMGAMSEALAQSARDLGVEIRTGAGVDKILVENGVAKGVVTEAGDEFRARVVFSSADPKRTFLGFLERDHLEDEFRRSIAAMDYSSATFKLNLALSKLPDFTALPGSTAGPQHRGTIHISPDMAFIDRAYHDALGGRPSRKPVLECTIPSVVDDSLAPEGHHTMGMFVQYAPFELADGEWDDAEKNAFATSCIDLFEEYAPGFKDSIVGIDPVSPLDLEREFGLTGGNIFHGAMTPSQLYFMRPVGECSGYATPLSGLYLCGAGSHPGGGVIGSCGRNAAREAMKRRAC